MARTRMEFSDEQLARAERLIGQGIGWDEVARLMQLGCEGRVLRKRLDPAFRDTIREAARTRMRVRLGVENPRDAKPPAADLPRALAARDKRARAAATFVRDVTALIMGDPDPGRREMMAAMQASDPADARATWRMGAVIHL